ncbi:MAG: hypothetical protein PHC28_13495 [Flavobacterium sp.]|uniref:hypothetical protein n=1 Tax=Flavobacterium sp. TaxID=239 RepID=UPI002601FD93|nr:hypothetical protein [Flavobacterium sp.]MDD5151467.1 hypothetical protein [Flavobacterium sp.]
MNNYIKYVNMDSNAPEYYLSEKQILSWQGGIFYELPDYIGELKPIHYPVSMKDVLFEYTKKYQYCLVKDILYSIVVYYHFSDLNRVR